MISPTEYGLALASVIAILFFFAYSDAEHADDKGCGCCLAATILLFAALYLVYFVVRLVHSFT